jgi:peptidoglycan hydrolase CwlO-like protein
VDGAVTMFTLQLVHRAVLVLLVSTSTTQPVYSSCTAKTQLDLQGRHASGIIRDLIAEKQRWQKENQRLNKEIQRLNTEDERLNTEVQGLNTEIQSLNTSLLECEESSIPGN